MSNQTIIDLKVTKFLSLYKGAKEVDLRKVIKHTPDYIQIRPNERLLVETIFGGLCLLDLSLLYTVQTYNNSDNAIKASFDVIPTVKKYGGLNQPIKVVLINNTTFMCRISTNDIVATALITG